MKEDGGKFGRGITERRKRKEEKKKKKKGQVRTIQATEK